MNAKLICNISKIIESKYKIDQSVNIYEAKNLIESVVKQRVDKKVIRTYLLDKGFKICEEKKIDNDNGESLEQLPKRALMNRKDIDIEAKKQVYSEQCSKDKEIENALNKQDKYRDLLLLDALELVNMDIDFSSYYSKADTDEDSNEEEVHNEVTNKNKKNIRDYSFTNNKILLQEYKMCGNEDILGKIVEINLKLVRKYANFYARFLSGSALSEDDLFQVGQVALLKAVENFDITMNFEFSTYATWWIKQRITREIADRDSTIRLPVHMHDLLMKLRKTENKYMLEVDSIEKVCKDLGITEEKYIELKKIKSTFVDKMVPLDSPIGEDKDTILGELLEDKEQESIEEYAIYRELQEELINILHTLTEREEKVIRLRFGIDDNRQRTLEEVGKEFKLTRERIRQIEAKALRKLRHPSRSKRFRNYIYD